MNDLPYLGDDRLQDFLDAWMRLLNDQEENVSDRQKELMFYSKIKGSVALKSYVDHYYRLPDSDPEHSYEYLLISVETYLRRSELNANNSGLATAITQNIHGLCKRRGKRRC